MEILLTAHQTNFVNSKVQEGGYADASEVVREALRHFEAGAHPLGETSPKEDIMATAFIVMMAAAKSAQEDLKAIMDSVRAINKAKEGLRELLGKVNRDVVRNAGQVDGKPQLDFSTGLGSEENYHRVQMPIPDEQASTGVAFIVTDLCPGPITTKWGLDAAKEGIKNRLDSLSEMGAMESLRLQMAMDRLSKLMSTMSNILQKVSDTGVSITQNIK
jgi:Arc/MetJ-type ribon-helix-helix transcriptional regulator